MHKTPAILLSAGLLSSLALGCERAADEQEDAVEAQREANREIAEANREVAEANREARDKAVSAQAEANEEIAEAQENFTKMRENFRHDTTTKLAELDKEIAELEAEAATLTGQEKSKRDAKLTAIRNQREQFGQDFQRIEAASATTWDSTKESVQKQLNALEDAIDKAD